MTELGERAKAIISNLREQAGADLHGLLDELHGIVRQMEKEPGSSTGSGFTQAPSVESDPEGKHSPGAPSGQY